MEKASMFLYLIEQPFLDISRRLCMNRSRLRRMLCRDIVEWENLQLDVSKP